MSESESGVGVTFVPGFRFTHPGLHPLYTLKIVRPRINRTRKITTKT